MNFQDEMQELVRRLQERMSGYRIYLSPDIKGLITITAERKDGNIRLKDFYDIIAIVDSFCQYRKFKFNKNKGDIYWWQGKKDFHDSEYQIGVSFPIYIDES